MDSVLHKTESAFSFDSLYVIESLDEKDGDKLTGTNLLKRLKPYSDRCKCLSTTLITVESAEEWRQAMTYLIKQSKDGRRPILHLEIHGTDSRNGLYIKNGDVIEWPEVLSRISDLNYSCECNLLVSFAVCFGQYLSQFINVYHRMPFCISLCSFEVLYEDDLEIRFFAFYKELLASFDIDKAYQALLDANKTVKTKYTLIKADVLFANVLRDYLLNKCTRVALKLRAEEQINKAPHLFRGMKKAQLQQFVKEFRKTEREKHEQYYKDCYENYFNLKDQPENRGRFLIFPTIEDLFNAFKKK